MALGIDTVIQTPYGPKKITDVKVGDEAFNVNGKTVQITSIKNNEPKVAYKLNFLDKSQIETNCDHKWTIRKRENKKLINLTTQEILENGVTRASKGRSKGYRYQFSIPLCSSVNFNYPAIDDDTQINAAIIGLLLGDGGMTQGETNLAVCNSDVGETLAIIESRTWKNITLSVTPRQGDNNLRFINTQENIFRFERKPNPFDIEIAKLGMNVLGKFKSIPDIYKFSSETDRIELIRGLMDSDGSCGLDGTATFSNNSEKLIDDMKFVIESLGCKAIKRSYFRKDSNKKEYFILLIQTDFSPFLLKRKSDRYENRILYGMKRNITEIMPMGPKETVSIKTNEENNSILVNNFLVAHGD